MIIIELLFSLYTTDFTAPEHEEIVATMMYVQQCKTATEPEDNCLNSYQKYLKKKDEINSGYGYIQ